MRDESKQIQNMFLLQFPCSAFETSLTIGFIGDDLSNQAWLWKRYFPAGLEGTGDFQEETDLLLVG